MGGGGVSKTNVVGDDADELSGETAIAGKAEIISTSLDNTPDLWG